MSTAGSLARWFRDELAPDLPPETAYSTLFKRAEAIVPGADGLLMLPHFSGERTPINDPRARGVIVGLTLAHTRDHLFRAVSESVAYGIRHNIETFRNIGADVRQVVAVGGGTKSLAWLQIVSDVVGIPQSVPALTIGASYGDAFLAGLSANILKREDLTNWVRPGYLIDPDPARHEQYEPIYQQYLKLYENTRSIIYSLNSNRPLSKVTQANQYC